MAYGYAFSPKAAKKANSKLAVLRGTRAQKSKMAAFESKNKDDEQGVSNQLLKVGEINDHQHQGGSAAYGRHVSKGGGIGKAESQERTGEIDRRENKRMFPAGTKVSAQPMGTPAKAKGGVTQTGPLYGGGGRNTQ
jgi:hypothetical protein